MNVQDASSSSRSSSTQDFVEVEDPNKFVMVGDLNLHDYGSPLPARHPYHMIILPAEEVASRNVAFLACYSPKDWKFFEVGKDSNGPKIIPEKKRRPCTEYESILNVVESSFILLKDSRNRRILFLKDRVVKSVRRYGEELSSRGEEDAQKFLDLAEKWGS